MKQKSEAREAVIASFKHDNLALVYRQATGNEAYEGREWYERALAANPGAVNHTEWAGVCAALSPQLSWERNLLEAKCLIDEDWCNGTANNIGKARAILAGKPALDVLGGCKTRSFYLNIAFPRQRTGVTIDRHAFSALAGRVLSQKELGLVSAGEYHLAEKYYTEFAIATGYMPHQVQAIIWLVWRRLKKEGQLDELFSSAG